MLSAIRTNGAEMSRNDALVLAMSVNIAALPAALWHGYLIKYVNSRIYGLKAEVSNHKGKRAET